VLFFLPPRDAFASVNKFVDCTQMVRLLHVRGLVICVEITSMLPVSGTAVYGFSLYDVCV